MASASSCTRAPSTSHVWLILSDSALPLGSFAFSSGLESYMQHQNQNVGAKRSPQEIVTRFLSLSLRSLSSTTMPYLIAAHSHPETSAALDDELDASISCNVARRASVSQGKALMAVWDKSLAASLAAGDAERGWVDDYRTAIRAGRAAGHFGAAWGLVCRAAGLELDEVCYVFMFNQAKAVLSAAVRLGLIGPYQAQGILAMENTRLEIEKSIAEGKDRTTDDAGQTVPVIDLYQGRHDLLYSRVFNS